MSKITAPSMPFRVILFGSLLGLLFFPSVIHAQDEFLGWLGPDLGKMRPTLQYQLTGYSEQSVSGQNADFKMNEHRGYTLFPIHRDTQSDSSTFLNVRAQEIRTGAILPDTRESFPETLWDIRAGGQYRRRFDNGWTAGLSAAVGSASDRPFAGIDEIQVQANLFARLPRGERDAWLFFLNYSNNREFLNHVPLPGIGYWYEPSDRARFIVGIPFLFVDLHPSQDVSLSFSYFPVRNIRARISYQPFRPVRFYGGFEWKNESFFRADRRDEKDRLFYYEKTLSAGVEWYVSRQVTLSFSGGFAFDRFYFEGRDYDDRDRNRLSIGNGPFLSARARLMFF